MKAAEQLREAELRLAELRKWRPVLLKIKAELEEMRDLVPVRRSTFQQHQLNTITKALSYVDNGFSYDLFTNSPNEGIPFDFMQCMNKRPGLIETDERIAIEEANCEKLRAYEKRWPTPDTKHHYRYTGKPYRHTIDGVPLEKGAVVLLAEGQALAFADRFEPVSA